MTLLGWSDVDGILLDLGVSSMQIDTSSRGFSFQVDGPLDMRFAPTASSTAESLVNSLTERELADLIHRYGEDTQSRRIARAIVNARPLHTTRELASVIEAEVHSRGRIHPATRTFQALRIVVNDELSTLETSLPRALIALKVGGRLAIISFHSLEDRIVKKFFRSLSKPLVNPPYHQIYPEEREANLKELIRKPIRPSLSEVNKNPKARSARLRVAEKIS